MVDTLNNMPGAIKTFTIRAAFALLLFCVPIHAQTPEPSAGELITRTFQIDTAVVRNSLPQRAVPNDDQKSKVLREGSATRLADDLRAAFTAASVQLEEIPATVSRPNQKAMFLNERTGMLIIRATADDLVKVQNFLTALRPVPQIAIETKFMETRLPETPDILQAGTRTPVTVNILTEKRAREILRQYEATEGADLITLPNVTTISGRQARIQTESPKPILYQTPPLLPKDTAPDADPTPRNRGRLPLPPTFGPERLGSAI